MISLQGKKRFSLSIKLINISFVVTVILVSVLTIITDVVIQSKQDKASEFQKMYLACDDAANILQKESDLLTLSISNYVDTMEQSSIEEYYEIIDKRLREKEIEKAEKYNVDCTTIREALELSNELAKREAHAFALIASANNNMDEMPIQVRESSLSKAELGLSKDQKIKTAQKLIHCKEYNVYKRYIYEKIRKVAFGCKRRFFVQNRPSLVGMMQNWLPNRLIRLHLLHGRNSRAMNFRFDSQNQKRRQFF